AGGRPAAGRQGPGVAARRALRQGDRAARHRRTAGSDGLRGRPAQAAGDRRLLAGAPGPRGGGKPARGHRGGGLSPEVPSGAGEGEPVSARIWYGGLVGGLLPVLLLGFLYSALADRTVFALWSLVTGALWVALLRQGVAAGWPGDRLSG